MKKLWKFYVDFEQQGAVSGLFIADEEDIRNAMGKSIIIDKPFGKHSEVYFELEECDVEEVKVSEQTISELELSLGWTICGYNPLHHIQQ